MITVCGLRLILTHYVDDYPCIEFDSLASSAQTTVQAALSLFGLDAEESNQPFGSCSGALGVEVLSDDTHNGLARVRNTKARQFAPGGPAKVAMAQGFLTAADARILRRRQLFARGKTFGRCGRGGLGVDGPHRRWAIARCGQG